MIRYIFLLSISILSLTGYSQDLQVFSSGGSGLKTSTIHFQGTIGEAVIFNTNTNFTQGFNQPLLNPICEELAKLINSTGKKTLCLDEVLTVQLENSYTAAGDKMEWFLTSSPTVPLSASQNHAYSSAVPVIKDSLYAIVTEGFCTDTSAKIPFEVIADNSINASSNNLCSGVVLSLAIPSSEIQWLLDGDKIEGATDATYTVLVSGEYGVDISNSSCSSAIDTKTFSSSLALVTVNPIGDVLNSSLTGDSYQWYIEIDNHTYGIVGATGASYTPNFNGNYKVEVQTNSCQGVSPIHEYTSAQYSAQRFAVFTEDNMVILNSSNELFKVYPNPNEGAFTISYLGVSNEVMQVKLYNAIGQLVLSEEYASANEIPIQIEQPTGLYILVVKVNEEIFKEKLIID